MTQEKMMKNSGDKGKICQGDKAYVSVEEYNLKPKRCKRTPILYTDFSKMDPNDPLIKAMEKRRPYCSSDFVPRHMIPDLRDGHQHC